MQVIMQVGVPPHTHTHTLIMKSAVCLEKPYINATNYYPKVLLVGVILRGDAIGVRGLPCVRGSYLK